MKKINKNSIIAVTAAVSIALGLVGPTAALAAATAPPLGTVSSFSVLAGLSMSAAAAGTTVSGDLGLSPGVAISRTGPWTVGGSQYFGPSSLAFNAQADSLIAWDNLAAQSSTGTWSLNPNPAPGVWTAASSPVFTGALTLNGSSTDVWVFQLTTDFTFSGSVTMTGGALACNVFWQIGRDATITSGSHFAGTLIASRNVTVVSGSTVDGRIIALNGSLTTDGNVISGPSCGGAAPATLHVIKLVVGGAAVASDFTVSVKNASGAEISGGPFAGAAAPGTPYSLAAGTYTVSENANASYAQSFDAFCPGGIVTLAPGSNVTCTIINTTIPLPPAVGVSTGGGRIVPLIGVVKVPNPLALPGGSGPVTYNYTVWNVGGAQALTDVAVNDDKCGPVTFLSGDANSNGKLDPHENWRYSCTMTLSKTTTNTSIATGYSDDPYHQAAIATALATVVVGAPLTPPLINIVKVPDRLTPFSSGGGEVTYTYLVTNPGVVAMHDVGVTDDKCGPVSRGGGDANSNNLLDPGEAWTYTCRTNVAVSTRNVATAQGSANGFTALGYAFATVLVSAPGLPNTGFPPRSTPWDIVALVGILLVLASLTAVLKKRTA